MKRYEIIYEYEGKEYTATEYVNRDSQNRPERKDTYLQRVLNRVESLVNAGAVIKDVIQYR